jgi:hypothetical protein
MTGRPRGSLVTATAIGLFTDIVINVAGLQAVLSPTLFAMVAAAAGLVAAYVALTYIDREWVRTNAPLTLVTLNAAVIGTLATGFAVYGCHLVLRLPRPLSVTVGSAVGVLALIAVITDFRGVATRWLSRGVLQSIQAWTVALSVLVFYHLCSLGTGRPHVESYPAARGMLFTGQLVSLLHGRLDVAPAYLAGEDWLRDGKSYAYFGLTPSLLRIPLLLSHWAMTHSVTAVYLTVALSVAMWASLDLCRRVLQRVSGDSLQRWHVAMFVAIAAQLSIGSVLLAVTTPNFYDESIAWGTAFISLALLATWRWFESKRNGWLWLAVVWLVLGAGSRPSAAGTALGIGFLIVLIGLFGHRSRRVVTAGLCMAVLPLTYMYGVLWLKFRSFTLDESRQLGWKWNPALWNQLQAVHPPEISSPDYLLTNLVQYLRPDSVHFGGGSDLIDYRVPAHAPVIWMYPLHPGAEATFDGIGSITARMPLAFLLTFATVVWLARRVLLGRRVLSSSAPGSLDTWAMVGVLISAGMAIGPTLLLWAMVDRYLGDFYPLMAAGTAFSLFWVTRYLQKASATRWVVLSLWALFVLWSIVVNFGLTFPLTEVHWLPPTPVICCSG